MIFHKKKKRKVQKRKMCECCCKKFKSKSIVQCKYNHCLCQQCFQKGNGCFYCNPSIFQEKYFQQEIENDDEDDIIRGYVPSYHLIPIYDAVDFLPIQVVHNHLLIQSLIIYIGFFGALLLFVTNTIEITNIPINTDTIGDILRRNQPVICMLAICNTLYKKIRN